MSTGAAFWDFALKLSVLPVSSWGLWLWWRASRRNTPPEPPGEVAKLLLQSLTEHPEQWHFAPDSSLTWAITSGQPSPVRIYYSLDPPRARIEGLLDAKLSKLDQTRIVEAIRSRADLLQPIVELPPALGPIARHVILSLETEPHHWHKLSKQQICFSPAPITREYQAVARLWVDDGATFLKLYSTDKQEGDTNYNFKSNECDHVWAAYRRWLKAHQAQIDNRIDRLALKALTQHHAVSPETKEKDQ